MKVRCLIEREGGSEVVIDDEKYHFKPEKAGGPHVCEVSDKKHLGRLLGIAEAYEVHEAKGKVKKPAPAPTREPETDPDPVQPENPYEGWTRGQLRTEVEERTGEKPASNMTDKALVALLMQLDTALAEANKAGEETTEAA